MDCERPRAVKFAGVGVPALFQRPRKIPELLDAGHHAIGEIVPFVKRQRSFSVRLGRRQKTDKGSRRSDHDDASPCSSCKRMRGLHALGDHARIGMLGRKRLITTLGKTQHAILPDERAATFRAKATAASSPATTTSVG